MTLELSTDATVISGTPAMVASGPEQGRRKQTFPQITGNQTRPTSEKDGGRTLLGGNSVDHVIADATAAIGEVCDLRVSPLAVVATLQLVALNVGCIAECQWRLRRLALAASNRHGQYQG